ncbi:MAG TPA: hypothetical protein VHB47_21435 [Thermoanaerobaculia bacterium]|jgi:hypothetical protein|nr:hypothetical protein [Thermoanaerobaculia bacterium]
MWNGLLRHMQSRDFWLDVVLMNFLVNLLGAFVHRFIVRSNLRPSRWRRRLTREQLLAELRVDEHRQVIYLLSSLHKSVLAMVALLLAVMLFIFEAAISRFGGFDLALLVIASTLAMVAFKIFSEVIAMETTILGLHRTPGLAAEPGPWMVRDAQPGDAYRAGPRDVD